MARILCFLCILFFTWTSLCMGDPKADQKECQTELQSLASCFEYVQGKAKTPTHECCTNLENVKDKTPKCLCLLIKDSSTPALGFQLNTTLALEMPSVCKVDANNSLCPALLNIPADSPEAKIFGITSNSSSSSSSSSSGSKPASDTTANGASNLRAVFDTKTQQGICSMAALVVTVASVSFFNIRVALP